MLISVLKKYLVGGRRLSLTKDRRKESEKNLDLRTITCSSKKGLRILAKK